MSLRIVPFAEVDPAKWDAVVDQNPNGWFWQTSSWIRYVAFREDHLNLSFAVAEGDRYRLVVPYFLQRNEIQMEGEPCPAPVGDLEDDAVLLAGSSHQDALGQLHRWRRLGAG